MTIRRQSKTAYSRKGWAVPFASGMEQSPMPSRSRAGFGTIGARNAVAMTADRQACRRAFAPIDQRGVNPHHGLAAQPEGGGTETALRLVASGLARASGDTSAAGAAPSTHRNAMLSPVGESVGRVMVSPRKGLRIAFPGSPRA